MYIIGEMKNRDITEYVKTSFLELANTLIAEGLSPLIPTISTNLNPLHILLGIMLDDQICLDFLGR